MIARLLLCLAFVITGPASTVIASPTVNLTAAETPDQVGGDKIAALCEDGAISGGHCGVAALRISGGAVDTIAFYNATQTFTPASNLKLLTTGAALHTLGPDFRFETTLACSGSIDPDGVLHGDIYIIGGGDPTLGAKYESSPSLETVFGRWKSMMTEAGIRAVDGSIVGDGRRFDDVSVGADWSVEDIGFYYGAPAHGLNFHENSIDFSVYPGDAVREPLTLDQIRPQTPWLVLSAPCTTGAAGTGDRLLYEASTILPVAAMTGTLALDRSVARESVVNHFPEYTCAEAFCEFLQGGGTVGDDQAGVVAGSTGSQQTLSLRGDSTVNIPVSGGPADVGPGGVIRRDLILYDDGSLAVGTDSLTVLGRTFSPALASIILETNHESDNFYADALLRTMGLRHGGSTSYPASLQALQAALDGIMSGDGTGVSAHPASYVAGSTSGQSFAGRTGIQLRDGSGLSRRNYLTPAFMVEFLRAMAYCPDFDTYLRSLPQPGRGTLAARLRTAPDSLRRRIYMKSGSMDGVRCFSGYILPSQAGGITKTPNQVRSDGTTGNHPDGTIVFAIFTEDLPGPSTPVYSAIDRIILSLP